MQSVKKPFYSPDAMNSTYRMMPTSKHSVSTFIINGSRIKVFRQQGITNTMFIS